MMADIILAKGPIIREAMEHHGEMGSPLPASVCMELRTLIDHFRRMALGKLDKGDLDGATQAVYAAEDYSVLVDSAGCP